MAPTATKEQLAKTFDEKAKTLIKGLQSWFDEEAASVDGSIAQSCPAGPGGSVLTVRPAIDSKRVLDATLITEGVLGIALPPEIIKPGGYESCEAMIEDIVPKLRKVFIGDWKVKKPSVAQLVESEAT